MAISGFSIRESVENLTKIANEPWFENESIIGAYTSVSDDGFGLAQFSLFDASLFTIGDIIFINGVGYNVVGTITDINGDSGNLVSTTISFNGGVSGTMTEVNNITWDEDTPSRLLREIHIQLSTSSATTLEVTEDGTNYMSLDNNQNVLGLATFTIFVGKNSLFNIRFSSGAAQDISCTVAAA